jgi:hypothetical protein
MRSSNNGSSKAPLAIRAFEIGLLPDGHRLSFVRTVIGYALEDGDAEAFTNEGIRRMFREEEWQELEVRARDELVPSLEDIRSGHEESCPSDVAPEDFLQSFIELCDALAAEFAGDQDVVGTVQRERERALLWIDEENSSRPGEPDYDGDWDRGYTGHADSNRRIFEDVDQ